MYKLCLKDAYFSVPLDQNSRKFLSFLWKETLYEFTNSNHTLEKNQHQRDMLILSHTIQETHMSWYMVIYLLQNLGFIINIRKWILHPWQKREFLVLEIDSIKMTLSLAPNKVQKNGKTCQNLLRRHSTTLLELTRVKGLLSSPIKAVKPAKIHLRFLQQQKIVCLRGKMNSVSNNIKHQVKNQRLIG